MKLVASPAGALIDIYTRAFEHSWFLREWGVCEIRERVLGQRVSNFFLCRIKNMYVYTGLLRATLYFLLQALDPLCNFPESLRSSNRSIAKVLALHTAVLEGLLVDRKRKGGVGKKFYAESGEGEKKEKKKISIRPPDLFKKHL